MGKRKSARKPQAKVKSKLATVFDCVYCSHEKSVDVKLDRTKGVGAVTCRVCQARWQTTINGLSAAIDVYSDWIDACEAASAAVAAAGGDFRDYQLDQYMDDDDVQQFDNSSRRRRYDDHDANLMLDESLG